MAERRQLLTPQFVIQTLLMMAMGAASAFFAGQIRTAVLDSSVQNMTREMELLRAQVTGQTNEFRGRWEALNTLINNSSVKSAGDIAELKTTLAAKDKEITALRDQNNKLAEKDDWLVSQINVLRDKVATIQGELNAARKKDG